MFTERTDSAGSHRKLLPTADAPARGWLLYDGECPLCTRTARRVHRLLAARGFAVQPLQTPWVRKRLGLDDTALLREMIVLTTDGRTFGGADAVLFLARHFWWAWPLRAVAILPGMRTALARAYRWVAARRTCAVRGCAITTDHAAAQPDRSTRPEESPLMAIVRPSAAFVSEGPTRPAPPQGSAPRTFEFLPTLVLPLAALATFSLLPPWAFMWLVASAIFAACKWLTWRVAIRRRGPAGLLRSLGYLCAWPGMDAIAFLHDQRTPPPPAAGEWFAAFVKTLLGATLIWAGVRLVPGDATLLAGWVGMFGLIFLLHFGSFHLLSLAWRAAGVNAPPLMRAPILSTSLGEFWSRRWNAAFHELVHRFAFRRLARRLGVAGAIVAVFVISGFVHELVISLPARAGFGWPTLYFALQGTGLVLARSAVGKRLGIAGGVRGRIFTLVLTALPLPLLFHAPFVRAVIVPFLHAIGAH